MFRFTIRDFFWLTVVVALAVGWYVERTRLMRERRLLIDLMANVNTPRWQLGPDLLKSTQESVPPTANAD
jgi:hypothetical protein